MASQQAPALDRSATAVITAGMNILRCFSGTGVRVCPVAPQDDDEIFSSRYSRLHKTIPRSDEDPKKFAEDLAELGKSFPVKPVLYYDADSILLIVSRYRELLQPYYQFLLPPAELVEDLVDKVRFARLAERLNLPIPRTLRSDEIESADAALATITLPCILKPDSRHLGWNDSAIVSDEGAGPQKVLIASTPEEFRRMYATVRGFTDNFVIQPYIPGGDDRIFSFHGYFNAAGEPLGYFVGQKIRTFPKNNGVSTYLELARNQDVLTISLDALRKMHFVGAIKIDLKQDPVTKRFYILEFNPRYTLWNHLGAVSGVNLPLLAYADQTNQPCTPQFEYRLGTRWLSFGNDARAFLRSYRPDGDLSWAQWLGSFWCPKVYDNFAWDDPGPLEALWRKRMKLVIGKITGRKSSHTGTATAG